MWRRRCTPYQPRQQQLQQQQVQQQQVQQQQVQQAQQQQQQQQHGCGCVSLRCWNLSLHISCNVIFRLPLLWYLYLHLHGQRCHSTQWIIFAELWWLILVRPAVWHCCIRSFDRWIHPADLCSPRNTQSRHAGRPILRTWRNRITQRWRKNGCFVSNPVCAENLQEPCKCKRQNTKS